MGTITYPPTFTPSLAISSFFQFFIQFSCNCLMAFLSSIFFNFISLESFGCLVSTGSYLVRFEATVIKILHLEGRWWNARNYVTFSLKNLFPSNPWQISSSPFCERYSRPNTSSWFSQITSILAQSIQIFVWSWSKNNLFDRKKEKKKVNFN